MRQTLRKIASTLMLSSLALVPVAASAGGSVNILILKEHGVGSAASAQQYVDELMGHVARENGWDAAAGKYMTSRLMAGSWISGNNPHYGIMSLPAYLDLAGKHKLEVIGSAEVTGGGGRQYFVVSASEGDLASCKGKTLGTDHADDSRFIDKVVGGSDFSLADFTVEDTRRPMKTVKAVARGEVACALIDDAQKARLAKAEGGDAVKVLWSSAKLPPMAIVAFPSAPGAEKKAFKSKLTAVCAGAGADSCKEVGLRKLEPASDGDYATVSRAYGG